MNKLTNIEKTTHDNPTAPKNIGRKFFHTVPAILFSLAILNLVAGSNSSALTYQDNVDVQFTFAPIIRIDLSDPELLITNLAPGASADSNIITVGASTNASYGYQLSATVGTKNGTDALTNTINNNYTFSNLNSSKSELSSFEDNTWGYSYCANTLSNCENGSSLWVNGSTGHTVEGYAGLPLDDNTETDSLGKGGVVLINSAGGEDNSSVVQFKIGAKASSNQVAGVYTNTINFYAVANPVPMTLANSYAAAHKTKLNGYYKMQDMNSDICNAVDVLNDELQVIDVRDHKIYWIAKLGDRNCWMTQNLDLDLESASTNVAALTSLNTDLNEYGTSAYNSENGYSCSNNTSNCSEGIITWTPDKPTIITNPDGKITGWENQDTNQYSLDTGEWYYAGYNGQELLPDGAWVNYLTSPNRVTEAGVTTVNDGNGNVFFSDSPFLADGTSKNGAHGHVGNYYNWSATVASNDTSSFNEPTDSTPANNPKNSICPSGWRLPAFSPINEYIYVYLYYRGSDSRGPALESSPLYLTRSGNVVSNSLNSSGSVGGYWYSAVVNDTNSYGFCFHRGGYLNQSGGSTKQSGQSVRCVSR